LDKNGENCTSANYILLQRKNLRKERLYGRKVFNFRGISCGSWEKCEYIEKAL
jgi:hypothetical protein